jgi:hypothetical protein
MILTRALRSFRMTLILGVVVALDFMEPGYFKLLDPRQLLPLECGELKESFMVPNLPILQTGLSKSTTIDQWKRRLGNPVCYQGGTPIWAITDNTYIMIEVNDHGIVTGFKFFNKT